MKITVLGGFLGSGKTTILIQMARYLVEKTKNESQKIKVAIIENEIGEIGIDDQFIRQAGYNVRNLFGGCACCSLAGELNESIGVIQDDLNPEWIILEATGVAYPNGIRNDIGRLFHLDVKIFSVVDAKRWARIAAALGHIVAGQLEDANAVFVNKTDLVEGHIVDAAIQGVRSYNSNAMIFPVSAQEGIGNDIFRKIFA